MNVRVRWASVCDGCRFFSIRWESHHIIVINPTVVKSKSLTHLTKHRTYDSNETISHTFTMWQNTRSNTRTTTLMRLNKHLGAEIAGRRGRFHFRSLTFHHAFHTWCHWCLLSVWFFFYLKCNWQSIKTMCYSVSAAIVIQ